MGTLNSHTEPKSDLIAFMLGLTLNLITDVLLQAGLDHQRDCEVVYNRTMSEGLGFLTKTLPSLGKSIQSSLKGDRLSTTNFKLQKGSALPHFMKGLLSRVFRRDGMVKESAEISSITDLLQVCFIWYKLEVPYDEKVETTTVDKFIKTDSILPSSFDHLGSCDTRLEPIVLAEARSLIHGLLNKFNPCEIIPKHGPGAVATGEKPHQKMNFKRIYNSVEEKYPFLDYFYLSEKHRFDQWDRYMQLEHVDDPQAKVMLVPKDSRGPRLISAEPLEVQYIQQGLGKALVDHIEHHRLTKGHVNFTDQSINRRLSLEGSISSKWDTLDMSEASDRVRVVHVKALIAGTSLYEYLMATRSTETLLPNGEVLKLRKFAPMGSALCFPVEALCFWALGVACLHVHGKKSLNYARRAMFVYGDDIIVRGGNSKYLLEQFHYYGLKFNKAKCCYTGSFRESCGCDAYKGHDISSIKIKKLPPTNRTDGQGFVSWMALANRLFQSCYYRTAEYATKRITRIWGALPFSGRDPHRVYDDDSRITNGYDSPKGLVSIDSAPCLYVRTPFKEVICLRYKQGKIFKWVKDKLYKRWRYNSALQRIEYNVLTVRPVSQTIKETPSNCWSELLRHINSGAGTTPYLYALLRRVRLKRSWVCLAH